LLNVLGYLCDKLCVAEKEKERKRQDNNNNNKNSSWVEDEILRRKKDGGYTFYH